MTNTPHSKSGDFFLVDDLLRELEDLPDDPFLIARAVGLRWEELEALLQSDWCDSSDWPAILSLAGAVRDLENSVREALPAEVPISSASVVADTLMLRGNEEAREVRSPMETMLVEIFEETLGVSSVGVNDDLFELGGHSLLATHIVARLSQALGTSFPLRELFEAPTPASLAQRIEDALQSNRENLRESGPLKEMAGHTVVAPLSVSQRRLWFLEQLDPGASANIISTAVEISGDLRAAVLRQALQGAVSRHAVLRTRFSRDSSGFPVQEVVGEQSPLASRAAKLRIVDLKGISIDDREHEAQRLRESASCSSFDLSEGPLIKVVSLRCGRVSEHYPDSYIQRSNLIFTLHSIVSDGWSTRVLLRDLSILCGLLEEGQPPVLPVLDAQYIDFSSWQRSRLTGKTKELLVDYWRTTLTDVPVLELPFDRPRPPVQTHHGSRVEVHLQSALVDDIEFLAKEQSATLFMVLLAVWHALLARLSGQHDFAIGSLLANRLRPEFENILGTFVNSLALRVDSGGDPTFAELVNKVRETTLGAYAHQELPFEMLLDELLPTRDLSRPPIFQVMIVALLGSQGVTDRTGKVWTVLSGEASRAVVDMTLWVYQESDGLRLKLEYNTDILDAATAGEVLRRFVRLMVGGVENPNRHVSELPVLYSGEEDWLLRVLGDGGAPPESARDYYLPTVNQQVRAISRRFPDAVAVLGMGGGGSLGNLSEVSLSYGQLISAADGLASCLTSQGVGPGDSVVVCMDRSPELIVALLGVLESGAAYLPLDPGYPPERMNFMIEDSGARLIISRRSLLDRLPVLAPGSASVVLIEELGRWRQTPSERVSPQPEDLAYTIYTSGSTGRPNGVMVTHASLATFLAGSSAARRVKKGTRVLQFASLSFDMSAEEIWMTLTRGGTLVLRSEAMLASPAEFLRRCGTWEINVLDLPTSWWHQLAAALGAGTAVLPLCITACIIGGEAALSERIEEWRAATEETPLIHTYGPTEATIVAVSWETPPPEARGVTEPGVVPIGRPVPGTRAYVLDRWLRLQPFGSVGELCLAGASLARGYLNRPGLTAQRFLPDPFSVVPGNRMYRSGDLVRWRRSSVERGAELEFIGRKDRQVKVRGFRVELAETEAALVSHPAIAESVVVAVPSAGGRDRMQLVGYIVPRKEFSNTDLVAYLAERLPHFMIPSVWVPLPTLPLTPNGKIDRKALSDPAYVEMPRVAYVEPMGAVEEPLAEIWADVLGLTRVSATDHFFEVGGDSILAVELVSVVGQRLGVELPLFQLFRTPVLRDQAAALAARGRSGFGQFRHGFEPG